MDGHVSHPFVAHPVSTGKTRSDVKKCFLGLYKLLLVQSPDAVDDNLTDEDFPVRYNRIDGFSLAPPVEDGQVGEFIPI